MVIKKDEKGIMQGTEKMPTLKVLNGSRINIFGSRFKYKNFITSCLVIK